MLTFQNHVFFVDVLKALKAFFPEARKKREQIMMNFRK